MLQLKSAVQAFLRTRQAPYVRRSYTQVAALDDYRLLVQFMTSCGVPHAAPLPGQDGWYGERFMSGCFKHLLWL